MKSKKTNAKRQVVSHTVQPVVGPSEWEGPRFGIWYPYPDIKPRPPRGHEKCECIVYAKWPVGGTVLGAVFTKTPVGKGRWNDGRHGHSLTNSVTHWMPMPDGPNNCVTGATTAGRKRTVNALVRQFIVQERLNEDEWEWMDDPDQPDDYTHGFEQAKWWMENDNKTCMGHETTYEHRIIERTETQVWPNMDGRDMG